MIPPDKVIYNMGPLSGIPIGEGRTFQVEDAAIAIFHTRSGKVFATQANCPHKLGPLADGLVGADKVVCPLHSYKFDLATGEALGNTCAALKTYSIKVNEQGDLLLTLENAL